VTPLSTAAQGLSFRDKLFASRETKQLVKTIEEGISEVEEGLLAELRFTDSVADARARYLMEAGGKRIRPMLAVLTAQLGSGINDEVVTAARSVEITHIGSLYHDDVMDEAPLRRGVPAAHKVFGNSAAILTGDLLFARASSLMSTLGERAIVLQAATFERLCVGQLHETVGPQEGDDPVAHYIQVLGDKTSSLIVAAARAGVIYSDADEAYEQPVTVFAEKVGVAFQLADDVIDLSPASETGKKAGTDLRAGVPTMPTLLLAKLAETDAAAADLHRRLSEAVESDAPDDVFEQLVTELYEHPVTAETKALAHEWADEAVAALAPLPEGAVKHALTLFAEHMVNRSA